MIRIKRGFGRAHRLSCTAERMLLLLECELLVCDGRRLLLELMGVAIPIQHTHQSARELLV